MSIVPPPPGNHIADVISVGAILGTFMKILPPLAVLLAIIWYCLEIYESKTVQGWLRRRHLRKQRRRHHNSR